VCWFCAANRNTEKMRTVNQSYFAHRRRWPVAGITCPPALQRKVEWFSSVFLLTRACAPVGLGRGPNHKRRANSGFTVGTLMKTIRRGWIPILSTPMIAAQWSLTG
jgi:hypothetical protein